jgi:hypothetical protein
VKLKKSSFNYSWSLTSDDISGRYCKERNVLSTFSFVSKRRNPKNMEGSW